jgi:hypothetical protein
MNDSGQGAAEPLPPPPPPPPSGTPATGAGKAGIGWRLLAIPLSLALAFASAVWVLVALNPDNTPRCDQAAALHSSSCLDITQGRQVAATILAWPTAAVAAAAALLGLYFAVRGRSGSLLLRLTIVTLVLSGIILLITKG